jgi:hypothetical protein
MSLLNQYRETELALAELQDRLQKLSSDDRLKAEIEFEKKLRGLMAEYGKSLPNVIAILDPQSVKKSASEPVKRRERQVKVYKNPNNGEVVETKGGNNKILKAWKAEHGADVVEGWLQA